MRTYTKVSKFSKKESAKLSYGKKQKSKVFRDQKKVEIYLKTTHLSQLQVSEAESESNFEWNESFENQNYSLMDDFESITSENVTNQMETVEKNEDSAPIESSTEKNLQEQDRQQV